jgi:dipeptidase D
MARPKNYPHSPTALWDHFWNFTQTPRPSGKEEKISQYVQKIATGAGLTWNKDKVGNIIILVPGSTGREHEKSVIIQNHLDMVTDAVPGHPINFDTDALSLKVIDGQLMATDTTLGADNGLGCCASLALLTECSDHPPLELLFTVDEETGLNGASGLDADLLAGKTLLNLDSEDWGVFYVGCAGGRDYELRKKLKLEPAGSNHCYRISLGGFLGGHSGIDIHRYRANAIEELCTFLYQLSDRFQLAEFRGGKAHNIIPRDAHCIIYTQEDIAETIEAKGKEFLARLKKLYPAEFSGAYFEIAQEVTQMNVLSVKDSMELVKLVKLVGHGPQKFDWRQTTDVLTVMSGNLARVLLVDGEFYLQTSLRAMEDEDYQFSADKIKILAEMAKMECNERVGYPGWVPQFNSALLEKCKSIYFEVFKQHADIRAIHAGLECGIINKKLGGVQCISFGPTIHGAHSPTERVEIETVENFWQLLIEILKIKNLGEVK